MKILARGRRLLRALRYMPDRLAHQLRRTLLVRRLERQNCPSSVLFVCHGNICRSPYAAAAFVRALSEAERRRIAVASAGFMGPNRPVPPEAARVASMRGIDLSHHRSELISAQHTRNAGLIIVMDPLQRRRVCLEFGRDARDVVLLGDLDPGPIDRRTIYDPIGQSEEIFELSYDRIDRCLAVLAGALARAAARNPIAWIAPQRA